MSETRERSALDPRDRLAVMVSMAGSYIESGRGDDALAVMRTVAEDVATEIARLARELEAARERERAVRDEATGYLSEVAGTLADMHDGEECRFEGGEGCLACYAQGRIGEMQDALAARTTTTEGGT